MDQDFYDEGIGTSKVKFAIIIIVVIGLFVAFYFAKKTFSFAINGDMTIELGSALNKDVTNYVSNKIIDVDEYSINLDEVPVDENGNVSSLGEYEYDVTYKNIKKTGKITIVDTTPPVVDVEPLTVGLNENYEAKDFLVTCDDKSSPCTANYASSDDGELSNTEGTYDVKLVISDYVGNETEATTKLTVQDGYSLANTKVNDLKISYTDPIYDGWDETMVLSYTQAFNPDDEDNYRYQYFYNLIESDISQYFPSKYSGRKIVESNIMTVYNRYGYIIGFAIRAKLDDGDYVYLENN